MDTEKRDLILRQITEHAVTTDDVLDILIGLEFYYDIRIAILTRGDVEDTFLRRNERNMTHDDWEKFRSGWLWRKGHTEIMWGGIPDAIEWELRDLDDSKADE